MCVRGFYADPGLVIAFVNSPTTINPLGGNWIRAHRNGFDAVNYLPTGNYTPQSLCDWANAVILSALGANPGSGGLSNGRFLDLDPVTGKCLMNEGNIDPTAVQVDFSVTMWRALGFGDSIYGLIESSPVVGNPAFGATSKNVTQGNTFESFFPVNTQPDRTLFVLYNGGVVDSYSTSTGQYRDYPGSGPGSISGSWPLGISGGFKERRVIAAISLLSGNAANPMSGNAANARIDYTAPTFSFSTLSTPFINIISLELATENWQVVPLVSTDYTIVIGIQECTPITQPQVGIPQPIVVPKKGDEKDQTKEDRDNEEYIRQLAQQIKKRRLEKAAVRVDEQQSLPE